MHRQLKRHNTIYLFYLLIDILFIGLSFYIPCLMKYNNIFALREINIIYLFWGFTIILLLNNSNLYKTTKELGVLDEAFLAWRSILLSSFCAVIIVFFLQVKEFSRLVFLENFILLCLTLSAWRALKRFIIRNLVSKGYDNFNCLIIGAGDLGKELVYQIEQRSFLGRRVIGFLDDYKDKELGVNGYKVLGNLSDLEDIAVKNFIDEVLITISTERDKVKNIIKKCKDMNISVKIVPDQFDEKFGILNSYKIGNISVLEYSEKVIHKAQAWRKRIMDIVLSFAGLILYTPLFLILAVLIKLTSKGPVFYIAKRYGKKSIAFDFYKFRSMMKDADCMLEDLQDKNELDGPIFKMKDDPRLTKIGRFMRRYSLDELPQLVNVLKGDMSIVGPRPLPIGQLESKDLRQLRRLEIKPGITGLWQVHGRSDVSFARLLKWDAWYINNWSLWLDFVILAKTVRVVLKGKGAY